MNGRAVLMAKWKLSLRYLQKERRRCIEGATLYVNLEPCCHRGKTGACTDEIIASGLSRVVCCHRDPNPVARGGEKALREAGVVVEFLDPSRQEQMDMLQRAVAMNARFLWPLSQAGPLVTLKWAMSLDGKIATHAGESQWISSPAGRAWALELRELHDAILVGSGTALADDPRLNRRRPSLGDAAVESGDDQIVRVVMDRRLRWQPPSAMFETPGEVLVFTAEASLSGEGKVRRRNLEEAGAVVVALPEITPMTVSKDLGRRGIGSLLVEGGAGVLGSFVDARLCHRVGVCCAPILIGGTLAPSPVGGSGIEELADRIELGVSRARSIGGDLVIELLEKRCLQDLLLSVAE